jgi:uncharacterized repeat protein (TIGR01451 family)
VRGQRFFGRILVLVLVVAVGGAVGVATVLRASAQGDVDDAADDGAAGGCRDLPVEVAVEAANEDPVDLVIVYDKSGSMEFDTLCYGCWGSSAEPSAEPYLAGYIYPLPWSDHTMVSADHCADACGEGDYYYYDSTYDVNDCNYRHRTYTDTMYTIIEAEEYSGLSVDYNGWGFTPYYTFWVMQRNDQGAYARDIRGAYLSHHPYAEYSQTPGLGVACTWDDLTNGEVCRRDLPVGGPFAAPRADYVFYAPRSADYYFWIRGQGGNQSGNRHVFWGVDGSVQGQEDTFPVGAYYDGASSSAWDWRCLSKGEGGNQGQSVYLAAGNHTLNLWAGGAGFDVDRIIVTTDSGNSSYDTSPPGGVSDYPPNNGRTDLACHACDPRFAGRPGGQEPPDGDYRPDCHIGGEPDQRTDPIYDDEQPMRSAVEAAKQFVGWLDPRFHQVGYVPYSSNAAIGSELQCVQRLGADDCTPQVISDTVLYGLDHTRAGGSTNIAYGMDLGIDVLSTQTGHYGRPGAAHVMVLMTDGEANAYTNCDERCDDEDLWPDGGAAEDCVVWYAREARDRGVVICTITLGWSADRELMEYVAELTGGYHYWAPTSDQLDDIFEVLYERLFLRPTPQKTASAATATHGQIVTYTVAVQRLIAPLDVTVHVTDEVPAGLSYVPGTLTATAGIVTGTTAPILTWSGVLSQTPVATLTYEVSVSPPTSGTITNTAVIAAPGYQAIARTATITVQPEIQPEPPLSYKAVSPGYADHGERITYTVVNYSGTGPLSGTIRFTDTIQEGLSYVPETLTATTGIVTDTAAPVLKWSGILSPTPGVTITYAAMIVTTKTGVITNAAEFVVDWGGTLLPTPYGCQVGVYVNWRRVFLPVMMKGDS